MPVDIDPFAFHHDEYLPSIHGQVISWKDGLHDQHPFHGHPFPRPEYLWMPYQKLECNTGDIRKYENVVDRYDAARRCDELPTCKWVTFDDEGKKAHLCLTAPVPKGAPPPPPGVLREYEEFPLNPKKPGSIQDWRHRLKTTPLNKHITGVKPKFLRHMTTGVGDALPQGWKMHLNMKALCPGGPTGRDLVPPSTWEHPGSKYNRTSDPILKSYFDTCQNMPLCTHVSVSLGGHRTFQADIDGGSGRTVQLCKGVPMIVPHPGSVVFENEKMAERLILKAADESQAMEPVAEQIPREEQQPPLRQGFTEPGVEIQGLQR